MANRLMVLFLLLAPTAWSQSSNGYAFFAPGGVSCCGNTSMTLHFGVGGEAVLRYGIGIGAEIGALAVRQYFADSLVGVFSPNGYYHFFHGKRVKVDPFVTGGYSLMFRSGHINLFNFGGGLNYWSDGKLGLRIEVRDHVHDLGSGFYGNSPAIHYWGVRVGLAFR